MNLPTKSQLTSYRNTELSWVAEVPSHWEIRRSKFLFTQRRQRAEKDDIQLSATQSYGVIPQYEYERLSGNRVVKIQLHLEKRKHVEVDDFVISMRSFQGGLERAMASGCIRSSYVVLKPLQQVSSAFYAYVLKLPRYISALQQTASFIRDGQDLNFWNFCQVDLFIPPFAEQTAIANFLDKKTALIDEAIAIKEQQIALLKERQQIIIQQAVTRGLDPDVPMKDSGVDWIGEIPAHWECTTIKRFVDILPGFAFKSEKYSGNESDIKLLRGVNVAPGHTKWNEVVYWPKDRLRGLQNYQLSSGDLVIAMDRPWISSGIRVAEVTQSDLPCLLLQRVGRIRGINGLETKYCKLLLSTKLFLNYFEPMLTGISVPHISSDQIEGFRCPLPPKTEQVEILNFVFEQNRIGALAENIASEQIQKLNEYKTTLINSAVTGKIKVA